MSSDIVALAWTMQNPMRLNILIDSPLPETYEWESKDPIISYTSIYVGVKFNFFFKPIERGN